MAKFFPRTLFGRNFLLLVTLIIVTQIVAFLFYAYFVQRSRLERIADLTALQINLAQQTVADLSPDQRTKYLHLLSAIKGIRLVEANLVPPTSQPSNLLVRAFAARLLAQLSRPESLVWHEQTRSLFIRIFPDTRSAYVAIDMDNIYAGPSGAALGALLVAGLAALLGAYLVQQRLNRPLVQLAASASALGRGLPPIALDKGAPTEIKAVSDEINRMAENLVRLTEERTIMLAGVSHDLRTPIAKMRLCVEMLAGRADESLVQSLEKSAKQMEAIVNQFIDYARTGQDESPVMCDIAALVRETVALLTDDIDTKHDSNSNQGYAQLIVDIDDTSHGQGCSTDALRCEARPLALARALGNLINNAKQYGQPEDGSANVITVAVRSDDHDITLSVMDRGPGIFGEDAASLIQPFTRRDAARSDSIRSGLGLAIVDRAARLHGGELKLEPRDGGGLVATILIPNHWHVALPKEKP